MQQGVRDRRRSALVATHVDPRIREQLVALAQREDRSVSSIIRRALDRELERTGDDEMEDA